MTFTYKLSRRLAVVDLCLAAAVLMSIGGCESVNPDDLAGPMSDSIRRLPKNTPSSIAVRPASLTAEAQQLVQLSAIGYTLSGDSVPVVVTWSASGGSISSTGGFSSSQPGSYRVVARAIVKRTVLVDTAAITVIPASGGGVVRLVLSPDTATVAEGQTRSFVAMAQFTDSSAKPIAVAWSATGGTIDSAGTYKAGTTPGKFRVIAKGMSSTVADTAAVTIPTPPTPTLTQIVLTPSSASMSTGQTTQFAAFGRMSNGDSATVAVTYTAAGGTVTPAGVYTAGTMTGTYRVIALQQGGALADTSSVTVTAAPAPMPTHAGHQVTPTGGSGTEPWSLAYALSGAGGQIKPGDTVWVRGGTYATGSLNVTLAGTPSAPVIVRAYPGERAVIDGRNGGAASSGVLTVNGGYVWYWGLEITNSNAAVTDVFGFNVFAPGVKFINCIVHDVSAGNAIWEGAANTEVTGCLIYNTGYAAGAGGGGYGHGIYTQSMDPNTNLFRQNILYNNYGWGFHAYAEGGHIQGYTLTDNIAFGNGIPAGSPRPGFFIGGGPAQAKRVTMLRNSSYMIASVGGGRSMELGWSSQNADVDFEDNWMAGGDPGFHINRWTTAIVKNNRFNSRTGIAVNVDGGITGYTWQNNQWWGPQLTWGDKWRKDDAGFAWAGWKSATGLGATDQVAAGNPTSNWVRVAKNPYEAGRGLVVVYNWTGASSVNVDLSAISGGQAVEVRNVQAPFAAPVATGSGVVSLPMVGVSPPTPLRGWSVSVPVTGPEFQTFVVVPAP